MYLILIISIFTLFKTCDSAKILAIMPSTSYSHQVTFRPIWKELSLRGHQITLLTTDPMRDQNLVNITEIDLSHSYEMWNKTVKELTQSSMLKFFQLTLDLLNEIGEYQLSHPSVQNLIKNENETFDLVMVELGFNAYFAFGYRFKCPTIVITSFGVTNFFAYLMGNPNHPIIYPPFFYPSTKTLIDRVVVTLLEIFAYLAYTTGFVPQTELMYKHFGSDYPSFNDLANNVSLMFTNSDPVFHKVMPLVPSIIQIGGGVHRDLGNPLPDEIQGSLDSAKDGFIYFSLGSNVKSADLPEETRNIILETFAELPYTVLWKFELDNLPKKSDNVITSKWLPQMRVLSHPNLKLFITQGGLQSMEEAVYNHVPFLVMPFFCDQDFNSIEIVQKGLGLAVDHKTLNKEDFKDKILEVIKDHKYKDRVKELAELALDQPMNGIEKAVWWTEYVIRHKGAKHLRSPLLDVPIYQYFLLDVIAIFIVITVTTISLFMIAIKCITKLIFRQSKIKVH